MFAGIDVADDHASRSWTAIASFTAQAALLGAALMYPILHPQTLSDAFRHPRVLVPMSLGEIRTTITAQSSGRSGRHAFVTPLTVGRGISLHPRTEPSPDTGFEAPPGIGTVVGTPEGLFHGIGMGAVPPTLQPPTTSARIIRLSRMTEGMLVRRIEPRYPPAALIARIEGPVKIKAIISREGIIKQAEVLSGSPLLAGAALEAIRQWRYRPYILNGEPVEVETQITVNFVLDR